MMDMKKVAIVLLILAAITSVRIFWPFKKFEKKYDSNAPRLLNINEKNMRISSPAFGQKGLIPAKYACDGQNISPPLEFSGAPAEAKSLALIMDDPDAPMGIWVHWILWNIKPGESGIKENSFPAGAAEGTTSFGKPGYGGPCPPSGTHRYFFKLYALDSMLDIPSSSDKEKLLKSMEGHIIVQDEFFALYSKK